MNHAFIRLGRVGRDLPPGALDKARLEDVG